VDTDTDSDSDSDTDVDTDTWPNGDTAPDGYGEVTEVCWVTTFSSEEWIWVVDMAATTNGSAIVVGGYRGAAVFGEGESNETLLEAGETTETFIAKFSPAGALDWAKRVGVTSVADPTIVAVDSTSDNGAVVLGHFTGSVTFGEGEENETTLVSVGQDDFFLARYCSEGQLVWARRDGGEANVQAQGMAVLPDDSVAAAGGTTGAVVFGEGELHETELPEPSRFLARFYQSGDLAWIQPEGGLGTGPKFAVHEESGDFLVSGEGQSIETFGSGQPNETTLTYVGGFPDLPYDSHRILYWASYEEDGTLRWARSADCAGSHAPSSASNLPDGSYAIAGWFLIALGFGMGETDEIVLLAPIETDGDNLSMETAFFVARISDEGDYLWAFGSEAGFGNSAEATNAASLPDELILISGSFNGAVNFGLGDPEDTWLVSSGDKEPFAAAYDNDGNLVWVVRLGTSWSSEGGAAALAGLEDGNFLVAGDFSGTGTFINGESEEPIEIEASGETDGFLMLVCPSSE
jgi:hypothetical protein